MQPGLPLLQIAESGGNGVCPELFSISAMQSVAPSAGGGRSLSGAAWRRRRAVSGPLMTSPGRSRSSSGRFRASERLRPFQGTSRDVQHHRWTVRMWNAASSGGFWQGSSYIQVDIWQGSSWRGLCRAWPRASSDPSFSIGVSQWYLFV